MGSSGRQKQSKFIKHIKHPWRGESCRDELFFGRDGFKKALTDLLATDDPVLSEFTRHEYRVLWKTTRCQTLALGVRRCQCEQPECREEVFYSNSCQTRFCPTCSHTFKQRYLERAYSMMLDTNYFFLTFTLPWKLRTYVKDRRNRNKLLTGLKQAIVDGILEICRSQRVPFEPGITLMIHTYNKQATWHPHVHLIVTAGGIALEAIERYKQHGLKDVDPSAWVRHDYFPVEQLKKKCSAKLLSLYRKYHKNQELHFGKDTPMDNYEHWDQMLQAVHFDGEYVHIRKDGQGKNSKVTHAIEYAVRYMGHPPVAMGRFVYNHTQRRVFWQPCGSGFAKGQLSPIELPLAEFAKRMADHIPNKHFRMASFYGLYSFREQNQALKIAQALPQFAKSDLKKRIDQKRKWEQSRKWAKIQKRNKAKKYFADSDPQKKPRKPALVYAMPWRERIKYSFGNDPLCCPKCGGKMKMAKKPIYFPASFCQSHALKNGKIVAIQDTS